MRWLRWLMFGWLAAIMAFLAGGKVKYPKPETKNDRLARLLSSDSLSRRQQKQLDKLLSDSEEVVVLD